MILILGVYLLIGGLLGWRLFRSLHNCFPLHPALFWVPFFLILAAFPLSMRFPRVAALSYVSAFALSLLYFFTFLFPIAFLVSRWVRRVDVYLLATAFALLVALPLGIFLGRSTTVVNYDVTFEKPMPALRIALVSDFHLGPQAASLSDSVAAINATHPDVVLIAGDLLDSPAIADDPDVFLPLRELESVYGVYAVAGNHDRVLPRERLLSANVTLLEDEVVKVADAFYLAGRRDKTDPDSRALADILTDIPRDLPLIVLDHNPSRMDECVLADAELMLSGHTHNGQVFPFNFIVNRMFPTGYGWTREEDTQLIVSSGIGTWGTPVRTSGRSEIVLITAKGADS